MTICRRHPAFGWLSLQGADSSKTFDKLIEYRDKAVELDSQHSGMPEDFVEWCMAEQLPSMLHIPFYRKQIEERAKFLSDKSEELSCDIRRMVGGLIDLQDQVDTERYQLTALLGETE